MNWSPTGIERLLATSKETITRKAVSLATFIVRFMLDRIFAKVSLCTKPCDDVMHVTEMEDYQPDHIWTNRENVTYLLSNGHRFEEKKGMKGKQKPLFDEVKVLMSDKRTTEPTTYTERFNTAIANARNRKFGHTITGIISLLDYPLGAANPLTEYTETRFIRHGGNGSDSNNPFLPREIIKVERQGVRYYALRFGKTKDPTPLIDMRVPKMTLEGVVVLLTRIFHAFEISGLTDSLIALREIMMKKNMPTDKKIEKQPYEKFCFSDITPTDIPTSVLEDNQRIAHRQYVRLTQSTDDSKLLADLQDADWEMLKKKQTAWLTHLTELTNLSEARHDIFDNIVCQDIDSMERLSLPVLLRWCQYQMSIYLEIRQKLSKRDYDRHEDFSRASRAVRHKFLQTRNETEEQIKNLKRLDQLITATTNNVADNERVIIESIQLITRLSGTKIERSDITSTAIALAKVIHATKDKKEEEARIEEAVNHFLSPTGLKVQIEKIEKQPEEEAEKEVKAEAEKEKAEEEGEEGGERGEEEGEGEEEGKEEEREEEREEEEKEEEGEGEEEREEEEEEEEGEGEDKRDKEDDDDQDADSEGQGEEEIDLIFVSESEEEETKDYNHYGRTDSEGEQKDQAEKEPPSHPFDIFKKEEEEPVSLDAILADLVEESKRKESNPEPEPEPEAESASSLKETLRQVLHRKREISFEISPKKELHSLKSDSFFKDESLKIDSRSYATAFTTSCRCIKKTVIGYEIITSTSSHQHEGYILSVYPNVCPHLSVNDPLRKDMFECTHGKQRQTIEISPDNRVRFECNQTDDSDHLHYMTTRIVKIAENPTWNSSHIHRCLNSREIDDVIKNITSSPNYIRHICPYEESRSFQIVLNSEGSIETIYTNGLRHLQQKPESRRKPDYHTAPNTKVTLALTLNDGFYSWKQPHRLAATFEATTEWESQEKDLGLRHKCHIFLPRNGLGVSQSYYETYEPKKDECATTVIEASPIVVTPVFENPDMDLDLDEFLMEEAELMQLGSPQGSNDVEVNAIEEETGGGRRDSTTTKQVSEELETMLSLTITELDLGNVSWLSLK